MKIIKLYAYLENNLGDDLMVEVLLNRYPQCIFFYSDQWSSSDKFLRYKNFINKNYLYKKFGRLNHILNILTLYRKKDFFFYKMFKWIDKKTNCSVYIGGSIYMQFPRENIEKRIIAESQKLTSSPLFIIGANFGPYKSEQFVIEFHRYFEKCAGVTFRDLNSYQLFKDIEHVTYAPDVVFNIPEGNIDNKNLIVISVMNLQRDELSKVSIYENDYKKFLVEVCNIAVKKRKVPVLVSFCENQGDNNMVNSIYEMLSKRVQQCTERILYNDNMTEIVELFRKSEFIIATRFHAMILAMKFSKPFFAIAYNSKMVNVLLDCGCNTFCELKYIEQYRAENVLDNYNYNNNWGEMFTKKAEKQFMQLDEFLKRGEEYADN